MNKQHGAICYIRVSTEEQARDALNLNNQERRCRDFCVSRNLHVVRVFTDPGQSARSADRPEFQKMLGFCRQHRQEVSFVVVYDLSRFARNVRDQADTITLLLDCGVKVRSTLETNIDESPAGRLAANIHGSFNQYFSDSLSERMKERSRAAVQAGRWPWSAPLGYKNVDTREGANIVPDSDTAPHIRNAFELFATGLYTQRQVLDKVTEAGLRTSRGNKLSPQTFYKTLRRKVYLGFIESSSINEPIRGLHQPIVEQAVFDRVQDVLDGKKAKPARKYKYNAAFPLKPFVRCSECNQPLTGGFARSKTGRLYPRYWCRTPGCRAVGISRELLESTFTELLRCLSPTAETQVEFPKLAAQVWEAGMNENRQRAKKLQADLEKIRTLKKKLLSLYLEEKVEEADFQSANIDYAEQIMDLERELRDVTDNTGTTAAFVRFAELQLNDLPSLWKLADDDHRRRVQTILFRGGIFYSQKTNSLNPGKPALFNVLQNLTGENVALASPTGFEPVLPP